MPYPWRPRFNEAATLGHRVAVCDVDGRMLACANLDGHVVADIPRLDGTGWHEFLDSRDLPAVLAYFRNGVSGDALTYGQLCRINGQPVMADVTIVKTWVGGAWLCYGAVRERRRPARQRQLEHGD